MIVTVPSLLILYFQIILSVLSSCEEEDASLLELDEELDEELEEELDEELEEELDEELGLLPEELDGPKSLSEQLAKTPAADTASAAVPASFRKSRRFIPLDIRCLLSFPQSPK